MTPSPPLRLMLPSLGLRNRDSFSHSEETLLQVLSDEPLSPRTLNPAVPRDLDTIALKCLHKDAGKRYASAREMGDDLARFLAGEPIRARPVGVIERGAKWVRRNKAVAALLALVSVTLTAATAVSTLFALDARQQERVALGEKEKADREAADAKAARDEAKAEAERARMSRHGFMMTAAFQAWKQNDLVTAEAILSAVPGDLRQAWEYRHLTDACRRKAMTLRGHTDSVKAVAYSPDGRRLVSASEDRTLKVWDAVTGQELLTLKGHADGVAAVAYSPDGSHVASGGDDKTLRVWDARTGRLVRTIGGHTDAVGAVAYSPDGSRLLSGSDDGTLRLWDSRTGKNVFTLTHGTGTFEVESVAYSPDGRRIVSAGLSAVMVWDARTGQEVFTLERAIVVEQVAYSPDGSRIVTASLLGEVTVWDAATGQALLTIKDSSFSMSSGVAFSPDGSRVLAGRDDGVKVWDAKTGRHLLTLKGHPDWAKALACSPDGLRVASAGRGHVLRVWDFTAKQSRLSLPTEAKFGGSLAYAPDGTRIAWTSGVRQLRAFDVTTGQELQNPWGLGEAGVNLIAYSPDGSTVVAGGSDATLLVLDARTGQQRARLRGGAKSVSGVAYSPDGTRLAAASHDRTLEVWDPRTGQHLLTLDGHAGAVLSVAYSPDGRRLVSASEDRTLKVWDAKTGEQLRTLEGHAKDVRVVAYSPDGSHVASGGDDKTLRVWDASTGQCLLTIEGHSSGVKALAYTPDGSRLLSGDGDGRLKLWDAQTGQELIPLEGHAKEVLAVALSRNGASIASLGDDEALRVWEAPGDAASDARRTSELLERARIARLLAARGEHAAELDLARRSAPFVAIFHLDRLLALSPEKRSPLLGDRSDVLTACRQRDHESAWASRALARQAVADFSTIPAPDALLADLARHPDAALDRDYGALLLRTGNAHDAAAVFRAVIRHRQGDQPPTDELLLALALVRLDRRDEARQQLKKAVAWMDQGTMPQRAASHIGLRAGGPLAPLAATAQAPPDSRLNPLDPFIAHQLASLRAEAERALASHAE